MLPSRRMILAHFWLAFGSFGAALLLGEWQMFVRSPLHAWIGDPELVLPLCHRARHHDGLRVSDTRRRWGSGIS